MTGAIRLGTRGSDLALAQTAIVIAGLRARWPGLDPSSEVIRTTGDAIADRPLNEVGGKGLFTAELEEALLSGRIHAAVHSLKDLPTGMTPGLVLGAVLEREDPSDALVAPGGKTLDQLAAGARIGTSSLRRRAQVLALRRDLLVVEIRGNVATRIAKAERGECDATLLARAGLARLGLLSKATEVFPPSRFLPAPGQGAIGVQACTNDAPTLALLAPIDHRETRLATAAERALLGRLEGGCHVPVGAWARFEGESMRLDGLVASPSGDPVHRATRSALVVDEKDAESLGMAVAEELLAAGASGILSLLRNEARP